MAELDLRWTGLARTAPKFSREKWEKCMADLGAGREIQLCPEEVVISCRDPVHYPYLVVEYADGVCFISSDADFEAGLAVHPMGRDVPLAGVESVDDDLNCPDCRDYMDGFIERWAEAQRRWGDTQ